nr:hypothetical protein GCM10025730_39130 [Promicromonospora thailandica]
MTENDVTPLDGIDRALVDALRNDGRTTLAVLSEISGLSLSAVQVRVRKLEARGVITGYRAVVNPEAVGLPLSAFVEITPWTRRRRTTPRTACGACPASSPATRWPATRTTC